MALPNLAGQNIETTYQRIVHTDGTNYYNGAGTLLNIGSGGSTFPFSGSAVITGSLLVSGSLTVSGSLNVTQGITGSLFGTSSWSQNSISSSYPLTVTGSTLRSTFGGVGTATGTNTTGSIYIGLVAGNSATNASNSNFLGSSAGISATNANNSNFFGQQAGQSATNARNSNFLGYGAGFSATHASQSNFIGWNAGSNTTNASNSNFLGAQAGAGATNAFYSNFLGTYAGQLATNANNSNFFGQNAGYESTNANNSNFLGQYAGAFSDNAFYSNFLGHRAGTYATSASYSTLLGFQAGYEPQGISSLSIGSNNIIIGTNITLPAQRKNSINLGGIIFATGSYSTTTGNPYSGSQFGTGRVGINVVNPTYTLEVGGTVAFPNITNVSHPDVLYRSNTGEITYAAAPSAGTAATVDQINTPDTERVSIGPQELEQSKYTTINIYNNLNFI